MKLHDTGVYLVHGVPQTAAPAGVTEAEAKRVPSPMASSRPIIPAIPCRTCA